MSSVHFTEHELSSSWQECLLNRDSQGDLRRAEIHTALFPPRGFDFGLEAASTDSHGPPCSFVGLVTLAGGLHLYLSGLSLCFLSSTLLP